VLIRRARGEDASEIVAAINVVCAEKIYLLTERYSARPQWEAVMRVPAENPDSLLLVPIADGHVIGWCRVFAGTLPKTRHVADVGIGLLAPFRGQGIGTALLQHALEWATTQDLAKLTADTFSTNLRARALFRKMDFEVTGVRRRQYIVGGAHVDQLLLERHL
jgi:putative acetyltransferase